jgi:predicted ABC-type ATPase
MRLVLFNGTCGSGKSTISDILVREYSFIKINGDEIIKRIKDETGKKIEYNSIYIYEEYMKILNTYKVKDEMIIIDTVFTKNDLRAFDLYLEREKIKRIHVLFRPQIQIAIQRTQDRICFPKKTPEYWVRYFHEKLKKDFPKEEKDEVIIVDNSMLSINETIEKVIEVINTYYINKYYL